MVGYVSENRRLSETTRFSRRKTYRPATSTLRMAWGMEKPSKTGTACVTPSPESRTIPVVRPEEYLQEQLGYSRIRPKLSVPLTVIVRPAQI